MPANPYDSMLQNLPSLTGVGESSKNKSKSDKELAKLQGKIQQQLAAQQAEYAKQLAAQQAAAALEQQQRQQQYDSPFRQADITGVYNGQATLAYKAQDAQIQQQNRQVALDELTQQQNNAIAQGNLQLAQQIETQKVQLQRELQTAQIQIDRSAQSGYLDNGDLTEAARAARAAEGMQQASVMGRDANGNLSEASRSNQANEAFQQRQLDLQTKIQTGQLTLQQAELMGYDASGAQTMAGRQQGLDEQFRNAQQSGMMANGQLTDASQQWRSQQGLQAAQMRAQLQQNPADYFTAAALQRDGDFQNSLGFLDAANQGSSMGFRPAMSQMPEMASVEGFRNGYQVPNPQTNTPGLPPGSTEGPSPSIAGAENAAAGNPAAFTTQMHTEAGRLAGMVPGQKLGGPRDPAGQMAFTNGPMGMEQAFANQTAMLPGGGAVGTERMGAPTAGFAPGEVRPGTMPTEQRGNPAAMTNGVGQPDLAQQRLAAMQPTFQAGAHKMAPGTLEAMSGTERGLFQGAAKASGINPMDFEQQYQRSRLQTGVSAMQI